MCEDKVLVELNKEQCQTGFAVGDIYLGKVRKIMPGLNAAFVNIGHEKDAFIHYLDLGPQFPSLQKLVASQQPGKRGFRVESMKLEPPVEKTGKIGEYLQVGQQIMVQVAKEAISTKGPRLTADISLAGRNVVLVPFTSKVFLSQKIRSADEKKRLKRIAAAVLPKNFGVIIRTAAMEAKDEDNQEQTAMDVNLAAAKEIARQLRLRDLGGIVIIDFIDLHKAQNKQALFDEMVKLMATDKAKHTVLPLTKFGLMQITRQRVRPVAVESVSDVCPTCNGSGKIEPTVLLDKKIENQISFLTQDRGHKFIKLVVSPYVAAFLRKGLWSLRRRWEWKYKVRLEIAEDQSIGIVEIHYHDKKDNDLITK